MSTVAGGWRVSARLALPARMRTWCSKKLATNRCQRWLRRCGSASAHTLALSARSPEALGALVERYRDPLVAPRRSGTRGCVLERGDQPHGARSSRRVGCVGPRRDDRPLLAATEPVSSLRLSASSGPKAGRASPSSVPGRERSGSAWPASWRHASRCFVRHSRSATRPSAAYAEWSILEQLAAEPGASGYRLDQIDVIQPVLVALAIAYAKLLGARGIEPDAVVGHSMGEVAAAHIAGVLDLDQAMRIICLRSALMRRTSGLGAMALVDLSMADAQARLAGVEERVTVAVSNSPRSSVLSGDAEAVRQLVIQLERDSIFCRLIKVDVASHSPQMDASSVELADALESLVVADAACPVYSTVLARRADGAEFAATLLGPQPASAGPLWPGRQPDARGRHHGVRRARPASCPVAVHPTDGVCRRQGCHRDRGRPEGRRRTGGDAGGDRWVVGGGISSGLASGHAARRTRRGSPVLSLAARTALVRRGRDDTGRTRSRTGDGKAQ